MLQDTNDILLVRDLTAQQQLELDDIVMHCKIVLDELNGTVIKFKELDPTAKDANGKPRRVWKRFRWDQKDITELRSRISSNVLLLNTFLGGIRR